jgi:hypothetical protein
MPFDVVGVVISFSLAVLYVSPGPAVSAYIPLKYKLSESD